MGHYRGTKCECNNIVFDSIAEKNYYIKLLNDKVDELIVHPKFILLEGFKTWENKAIRSITFKPDFFYSIDGQKYIEDVKPINKKLIDADFTIRWKLLQKMYFHDNIKFRLIAWDKKVNEFVEI